MGVDFCSITTLVLDEEVAAGVKAKVLDRTDANDAIIMYFLVLIDKNFMVFADAG
jgi:hypothetical protein